MKANLKKLSLAIVLIGIVLAIIIYEIVIPIVGFFKVFGWSWGNLGLVVLAYAFIGALVFAVAYYVFELIESFKLLKNE